MGFENGQVSWGLGGLPGGMAAFGYILFGIAVVTVVLWIQYKAKTSDH